MKTYTVSMQENTVDEGKWKAKAGTGEYQLLPINPNRSLRQKPSKIRQKHIREAYFCRIFEDFCPS